MFAIKTVKIIHSYTHTHSQSHSRSLAATEHGAQQVQLEHPSLTEFPSAALAPLAPPLIFEARTSLQYNISIIIALHYGTPQKLNDHKLHSPS